MFTDHDKELTIETCLKHTRSLRTQQHKTETVQLKSRNRSLRMSDELPVFWYMAVVDTAGMPVEPLSRKMWGDLEWTKETAECPCTAA